MGFWLTRHSPYSSSSSDPPATTSLAACMPETHHKVAAVRVFLKYLEQGSTKAHAKSEHLHLVQGLERTGSRSLRLRSVDTRTQITQIQAGQENAWWLIQTPLHLQPASTAAISGNNRIGIPV
eukprot:1321269-Rhodomonas_salina.1